MRLILGLGWLTILGGSLAACGSSSTNPPTDDPVDETAGAGGSSGDGTAGAGVGTGGSSSGSRVELRSAAPVELRNREPAERAARRWSRRHRNGPT